MLLLSAKGSRPPSRRLLWKTIWRTLQRANNTFWSNGWISSGFTERCIKNSSIWQESTTRNLSGLWADCGWNLEKWYFGSRFGRFGKVGRIRKLSSKNQRERSIDNTWWWIHIPSSRWYSKIVRETLRIPRTHSKAWTDRMEWRFRQGESGPEESTDDAEDRADFWSIQGDFIYRHHNEPRVQLHVPKEETFHVPLKYIDVTRSTHTDLDVLQEKRVDDCWNVDSNRHMSDSWRGFTKFTLLQEKPTKGYMWSGERLTKIQTTSRPDHVWSEVWTIIGKAAQNREKPEWAKEKPKLDSALRLEEN